MGIHEILTWWPRARLLKQVEKALHSTVQLAPTPKPLLAGSGVILVPFDPVEAALSSLAIRDICATIESPVRLAGPPGSLRWIPDGPGLSPIEIPVGMGTKAFSEWLEYHRAHRGEWCLLASPSPTAIEEACLAWLGIGGKIASRHACKSKAANILLETREEPNLDAHLRRLLRVLHPDLGSLPSREGPATSGPVVLEIPPDLPEKGKDLRRWGEAVTRNATLRPLLLAHSETLPPALLDLIRGLGPRVALVHLSGAGQVQELAKRAKVWVGKRSPASALAALGGCSVRLVGPPSASAGYPAAQVLTISTKIDQQDFSPGV